MKYIRDLEAAGFQRSQAKAQVQMVMDAVEGDVVTKSEFAVFREHIDRKFAEIDHRFKELELRMTIKLGLINATTTTIAVAIIGWLVKTK